MIFISKWPQLSWTDDKAWASELIHPLWHGLIYTWHPWCRKVLVHVRIPFAEQLLDLPKSVEVCRRSKSSKCQSFQNVLKAKAWHVVTQTNMGAVKFLIGLVNQNSQWFSTFVVAIWNHRPSHFKNSPYFSSSFNFLFITRIITSFT